MYDHILIPTDGSDEAMKGARHGVDLAASCDATVHVLYVVDLPGTPRTVYVSSDEDEIREEYHEHGEEVTEEIADMATDAGVDAVKVIKSGTVNEEIVEYAEDEDIDLIVMGTGYRGKVGSLLGSTAEKVVRTSSVPVTTIRMTQND